MIIISPNDYEVHFGRYLLVIWSLYGGVIRRFWAVINVAFRCLMLRDPFPFLVKTWEKFYSSLVIFIIHRFELSSNFISYWKLFWQISYRRDTMLKGVPNSCWTSRGSISHRWKQCSKETLTLPLCCWAGYELWYKLIVFTVTSAFM